MTSTVTIKACCAPEKEVLVHVMDDSGMVEEFTLQDGEEATRHIYDDRSLSTAEMLKDAEKGHDDEGTE